MWLLYKLAASEAPLTAVLAKMKSSGSGGLSSSHTQPEGLLRWLLIFLSLFTTPYPILDLGSGLKPPQNKHADARG